METATTRASKRRWNLASAVTALVIAALAGGVSTAPARADDNDWNRGHQQERHDVRHEHNRDRDRDRDREQYELRSYGRPAYVYSPPPIYYAPPPGPPVIDFVFPLNFR
jgi:hypothetical protein